MRGGNVYLLVDEALGEPQSGALALVDSGLTGNAEAILSYLERLGRSPRELRYIIVTHHHPDHAGSLAELKAATGAAVVAHPAETWADASGHHYLSPTQRGGRLERLFRRRTAVELLVEDGDVIPILEGLQVIHTPGHTPGGICLFLPQRRVLFTGDMVLNNGDRLSRPLPGRDRAGYETSLRRLAGLDFEVGCFGHGRPLLTGAGDGVRQMVARPYDRPLALIILSNWLRLLQFPGKLLRRHR